MNHLATALSKDYCARLSALRKQLCDLIDSLPDAAYGVTLIPGTVRASIVSSKYLQKGSWDPRTYMTGTAKDELKSVVNRADSGNLDGIFQSIIDSGRLRLSTGNSITLPQNFLEDLRQIWLGEGIAHG
jgi:hypothetical protein